MDRDDYLTVAKERFGDVSAVAPEGTPQLVYYTCPVCGWQVEHRGRYKGMPPHEQRVMTRLGVRVSEERCPGSGQEPELMPAWPTARGR